MSRTARKRYQGIERRITSVGVIIILALAVLGLRLWNLQVVHWADYARMAECNRLRAERLKAPRGMIFGRDETVVLADNRPSCDLVMVPAECGSTDLGEMCIRLGELLGIDDAALFGTISQNKSKPYRQILVKQDVSKNDLIRVEEFSYALPGVFTVARPQRRYLYGKTAGQILGYLGWPTQEEIEQSEDYEGTDQIGRGGLEQMYESNMRGTDGQLVVNVYVSDRRPQLRTDASGNPYVGVDSYGRKLEEEKDFRREPTPGQPIYTTLDIGLQQKCEGLIEGEVGAIVVIEADTGAVLALASSPNYDPTIFAEYGRDRERVDALTDKLKPMRNRCYQERYPPGSVFKVMLASAALEEGTINEKTSFSCGGSFHLPGVSRPWNCWQHRGHGGVSVVDALAFSCDVFFYNVGIRLNVDKIKEWSGRFGLGEKTGIDLPQEVEGLIPDPAWRKARMSQLVPDDPSEWRWYPGNTVNLAIGQGEAATTPLQNAVMMAAIINGGRRVRPYVNTALGPQVSEPFLSERTLELVRAGMRKCVEKERPAPTGTGKAARVPGMTVLGKTGTAQVIKLKKYPSEDDIPYKERDHAWFVAGVLDQEPKIAMCILVEHGLHGSSTAAPYAKEIIEFFYKNRSKELPSSEGTLTTEYTTEPDSPNEGTDNGNR